MNKESTTAAGPAVPLEKTPAAGLATPAEKIPPVISGASSAATSEASSRSWWPFSLSDIEAYLFQTVRPAEPKTEARPR